MASAQKAVPNRKSRRIVRQSVSLVRFYCAIQDSLDVKTRSKVNAKANVKSVEATAHSTNRGAPYGHHAKEMCSQKQKNVTTKMITVMVKSMRELRDLVRHKKALYAMTGLRCVPKDSGRHANSNELISLHFISLSIEASHKKAQ